MNIIIKLRLDLRWSNRSSLSLTPSEKLYFAQNQRYLMLVHVLGKLGQGWSEAFDWVIKWLETSSSHIFGPLKAHRSFSTSCLFTQNQSFTRQYRNRRCIWPHCAQQRLDQQKGLSATGCIRLSRKTACNVIILSSLPFGCTTKLDKSIYNY